MVDRLDGFIRMIRNGINDQWDFVVVVDGREGSGKSTFALHMKALFDRKYNLDHVLFAADTMLEEMQTAKSGSCIVLDYHYIKGKP
jgi:uridine kinase